MILGKENDCDEGVKGCHVKAYSVRSDGVQYRSPPHYTVDRSRAWQGEGVPGSGYHDTITPLAFCPAIASIAQRRVPRAF